MIEAIVMGTLHGKPEARTSSGGKAFARGTLRTPQTDGDAVFVRIAAFSESACAALLALDAGDSVAVAGTLKVGAWLDREGKPKPQGDMVAQQVLTVHALERRRRAAQAAGQPNRQAAPRRADAQDFEAGTDWLEGGR